MAQTKWLLTQPLAWRRCPCRPEFGGVPAGPKASRASHCIDMASWLDTSWGQRMPKGTAAAAPGLFGSVSAVANARHMASHEFFHVYGVGVPELQKLAMKLTDQLSLASLWLHPQQGPQQAVGQPCCRPSVQQRLRLINDSHTIKILGDKKHGATCSN